MLIYNFVSPIDGPTWSEYCNTVLSANKIYPLNTTVYWPFMIFIKRTILYKICIFFGHILPAILMDVASICTKRSPRSEI